MNITYICSLSSMCKSTLQQLQESNTITLNKPESPYKVKLCIITLLKVKFNHITGSLSIYSLYYVYFITL